MRLVIPYRLSCQDGIELRYAIRSMVKHFTPLSGVLLIGDRPTWYRGDHIPQADVKGNKERSMQLKVLQAPDVLFLYSNDDYYATQDFDANLPDYCGADCRYMAEIHPQKGYREMYSACPPTWLDLDVHTPMIMGRDQFKITYQEMGEVQTPIKTTYAQGIGGPYFADLKIRGPHSYQEIADKVNGSPFFSTHDSAVDENLIAFLDAKYPDPSPYEGPGHNGNGSI